MYFADDLIAADSCGESDDDLDDTLPYVDHDATLPYIDDAESCSHDAVTPKERETIDNAVSFSFVITEAEGNTPAIIDALNFKLRQHQSDCFHQIACD